MRATKVPRGVVLLYASAFLMAYEQVISFDNLYKGLKESCRNIRWKDSTVGYEGNALKNTYRLRQTLLNGTYKIRNKERLLQGGAENETRGHCRT